MKYDVDILTEETSLKLRRSEWDEVTKYMLGLKIAPMRINIRPSVLTLSDYHSHAFPVWVVNIKGIEHQFFHEGKARQKYAEMYVLGVMCDEPKKVLMLGSTFRKGSSGSVSQWGD